MLEYLKNQFSDMPEPTGKSLADELKDERNHAKKVMKEKTKALRNFSKKVERAKTKAKQLSDDGLVFEYLRRKTEQQARANAKAKKQAAQAAKASQS